VHCVSLNLGFHSDQGRRTKWSTHYVNPSQTQKTEPKFRQTLASNPNLRITIRKGNVGLGLGFHVPDVDANLDLRVATFLDGLHDVVTSTVEAAVLKEGDPGLAGGGRIGTA
jgi:hypothetical protein